MLRLEVPQRIEHLPGQHCVIRLTAPDGYVAQRSYSIANAPGEPLVELFVEQIEDGEVSGYLAEVAEPGDAVDLRGPIGGWFAWAGDSPAVAVGGGSGVVPLVSMVRHATRTQPDLLRVAVSSRTRLDLPYADELLAHGALVATTREVGPQGRPAGRLVADELAGLAMHPATWFVCGSADFAESMTDLILEAGVPADQIRVERFGPSG
jgi:ferredoxin-NADP reductase